MKILKWLGIVLGIVLLAGVAFASYVQWAPLPTYEAKQPDVEIDHSPEAVAMGRRLAVFHCVQCHYDAETSQLTGNLMADMPAQFGIARSANITNHPQMGIGKFSDSELYYLLRTGVKPDGTMMPPWMPRFNLMTDKELTSLIAWLRSNDELVAANAKPSGQSEPTWFARFLMNVAFRPANFSSEPIVTPDSSDKVALGKYILTGQQGCFGCHSASFETTNENEPELSEGYLGGGNAMQDKQGRIINTANITPDKETGIGNWTLDQFKMAMRSGEAPHGRLRYPMPIFGPMTEAELEALWAYLETVPAISNKVDRETGAVAAN